MTEPFAHLSIAEVRRRLDGADPTPAELVALRADPRRGVRELVERRERRLARQAREDERLAALYATERALSPRPGTRIAGVDEVGMGPLAGPVVAAAVILPDAPRLAGLNDSKQLPATLRARLAREISSCAIAIGIGMATRQEIDAINIYHAGLLAMRRAIGNLAEIPDLLAVDGRELPEIGLPQVRCVGGDARVACIAAASIVAKEERDGLMRELDTRYPGYGFSQHAGYGTPEHLEALRRLGPSPEHRRSFAPVRALAQPPAVPGARLRAKDREAPSCPTS